MIKEIEVAAKWWSNQLRKFPSTNINKEEKSRQDSITEEQIERFRNELEKEIYDMIFNNPFGHWNTDHPNLGRSLRVVIVDRGPDKTLSNALNKANITKMRSFLFPLKTIMWISPKEVKVAEGYGSEPINIYSE
jgi:hypothetical protein